MSQIYEEAVDKSLAAALSSIEIYNKPDFKYREEIFTILIINAWELLLKAKILKEANDDINSLYVPDKQGGYKQTRNGVPLTVEITGAMQQVGLDQTIAANLKILVEIRDTAIHFYHDQPLSYLIYTLAAASLQNYQKLIGFWFGKSLLAYNFFILPLGFTYNFKTMSLLELEREPDVIADLIKSVINMQSSIDQSSDFYFVCEITTQVQKNVQFMADANFSSTVDSSTNGMMAIDRIVPLIEQYPFSYMELRERVKKARPNAKQTLIDQIIRDHDIKNNTKMSAYNFRTKTHQLRFEKTKAVPGGTTCIYNENAVRFIISLIPIDII
jgi:Protein of unknown function (DUF3644)/EC042_2821-lke REase